MSLLDHIELALLELKAGYDQQAKQTLFAIIQDIKNGTFDQICPKCKCVNEVERT